MTDIEHEVRSQLELHRRNVHLLATFIAAELSHVAFNHDLSKFSDEEFKALVRLRESGARAEFGTEEYEAIKAEILSDMLEHHYAHNRHHPEHYEDGIAGMTVVDLVEMFCDWVAAGIERDGRVNFDHACEKYHVPAVLKKVFKNTVEYYGLENLVT